MDKYYKAGEAIKKLGIPRSSFFVLVNTGRIPKVNLPLRKQALYPREEIDKLAAEQAELLQELEQSPERLVFMLPSREDLEQLVDLDRLVFHEETLILPEEQQKRFAYNPEVIHVLKDTKTNTVLGGITISPLKQDVLEKLIRLEIDETQIKPEDYLSFTSGKPLDSYVIGIIARPGVGEKYYAGRLLYSAFDYLIELLERGVIIRRIYTIATTLDGERIVKEIGFSRLPGEWQGEFEDFRRPYVLDLEVRDNKSKLVQQYLSHKKNLERRQKRYENESLLDRRTLEADNKVGRKQ